MASRGLIVETNRIFMMTPFSGESVWMDYMGYSEVRSCLDINVRCQEAWRGYNGFNMPVAEKGSHPYPAYQNCGSFLPQLEQMKSHSAWISRACLISAQYGIG